MRINLPRHVWKRFAYRPYHHTKQQPSPAQAALKGRHQHSLGSSATCSVSWGTHHSTTSGDILWLLSNIDTEKDIMFFMTYMLLHWTYCIFWTKKESVFRASRTEVSLSYLYTSSFTSLCVLGGWFLIFIGTLFTWEIEEILGSFFFSNPCKRGIHTLK